MRVITYSRKSQDDPESVEAQTAAARSFCQARGYTIVQEFSDSGISGGEFANRPGFNAMLDAATAKHRRFDALVIRDVDRLGRDQFRTAMALQDITEHGVRVFCYGVNDGEEIRLGSFADKMMLSIRTGSADDFRAKISRDTRAKLHEKSRAGKATGTRTFGYKIVRVGMGDAHGPERCTIKARGEKKCPCYAVRVIIPEEQAVVERVFTMAASGIGNRRIADTLSAEYVPSPGKGWSKGVVKTMLTNRLYIGEVILGRTCSAAIGGQAKKRAVVKDAAKWTVTVLPELRIITDDLWRAVEKRRAATLAHFSSHRNTDGKLHGRPEAGLIAQHLLNGFLACGVCGGALSFMSKNGRTRAYYCQRRNSRGSHACTNGAGIPEQALDAAVIEALHKAVEDPEVAWALVTERTERWRRERVVTSDERANLQAEEKRLETAISRLLDHLETGEDVGLRLKQRRAELDALRVRLAEPEGLTVEQADFEAALARNVEWLKWRGPVIKAGDTTQTRAAMRALGIGKVVVTPTADGWTIAGDGNLAGMVGALGSLRGSPRRPHR